MPVLVTPQPEVPSRKRPFLVRERWGAGSLLQLPLLFLFSLLRPGSADVQQQYLISRIVVQDALNDPDFPSPVGSTNDIEDSQEWTHNTQDVRMDTSIIVEFAEDIQAGAGYITFQPAVSAIGMSSAAATTLIVPTQVSISGRQLQINVGRDVAFSDSTTYTVSFDAGVVEDLVQSNSNSAFSVQFTTGDFTKPTLISKYPVDASPSVDVSASIVLTFSENVQANGAVRNMYLENSYSSRQTPSQAVQQCSDTSIVISGATATIDPSTFGAGVGFTLLPCQQYCLYYDSECFTDNSSQREFTAALTNGAYCFWTSCISAYLPANASYYHLINENIELTFAEEVVTGTGDIVITPLGEPSQSWDVTDNSQVIISSSGTGSLVQVVGSSSPYLCGSLSMQNCKGKPITVTIAKGVFLRSATVVGLSQELEEQLSNSTTMTSLTVSTYFFTLQPADLTPPVITIVSMYGISESVIRVTVRLDESGTTYCRAYPTATFTPISQGGADVPTLTDCIACTHEIRTNFSILPNTFSANFVGSSTYDTIKRYAEHEVDITGLIDKSFYWVYCYSHDIEIPDANSVTSAQMLATERLVRTLDTTPPSITSLDCVPTPGTEDSITVTLDMNEVGTAYCKVVNRGFTRPSPNAVLAEGFYADVTAAATTVTIQVNQITTGLGATGMEPLHRKWDYDVYCWAQDGEGYPYHGPNGMVDVDACPANYVTTLDLTRPNMHFIMAESISASQILITLQVDEGAKVWCAAWNSDNYVPLDASNYEDLIKNSSSTCMDNKGRQCGTFWVYDLDDLEDTASDLVDTQSDYDDVNQWKFNQDVDIIVYNLTEETDYPYIFCYAEDDEFDGIGSAPNKMMFDSAGSAGPNNVHTITTGIGTVQTLDESPPSFTQLTILDPTLDNDRIVVTFSLNEAGTTYCRVTRSDSGETTLRINRILSANYGAAVANPGDIAYITIDKLEDSDTQVLYEAAQYDVYCWALDSAVDTQGHPRPNYMLQSYVDTPVGSTPLEALNAPQGGRTSNVWVRDLTPPGLIYVASEALAQSIIEITLQLDEPGTVWCVPVLPSPDLVYVYKDEVTSSTFTAYIRGRPLSGGHTFYQYVHEPYVNVDVEVSTIERLDGNGAVALSKETPYNIYCFAEDDWQIEASNATDKSVSFNYNSNIGAANEMTFTPVQTFMTGVGVVTTLDLTPPAITVQSLTSDETAIQVYLDLDETGTAWCQAVRTNFTPPTILEILDTNFYAVYTNGDPHAIVNITGYDRPRNAYNDYLTPLVLGTDYDVYCYANDDLCQGCQVTNGVSYSHVVSTQAFIRTKDYTPPDMRFVMAESIAHDQIIIVLQVDEGARVWCAAWMTDPGLTPSNYESEIKAYSPQCSDNKGRTCGTFWVYDLDDLEDDASDGVVDQADYDSDTQWRFNQDVKIILDQLQEETDYPFIYCYAEDDESTPNKMIFDDIVSSPNNVHTMYTEIGTVQTLDESPPSFTYLAMRDPTLENDRIAITFQLNEAGTAYCRVTRSDSGETTLLINQILSANYYDVVMAPLEVGNITVDKLESTDPASLTLYEASQYDVYCWAKDSAVDTQGQPRPNYMLQSYLESDVSNVAAPQGGKTPHVWVKDTTPPTVIYVSSEALSQHVIQITLQLNEPGTVWCHPVEPSTSSTYIDVNDVTQSTYIQYIKGRTSSSSFEGQVHIPYFNVDVEVDQLDMDTGAGSSLLQELTPYNIYCFAEDDWEFEAEYSTYHSPNFDMANAATVNMTQGKGNEITLQDAEAIRDAIGLVTTLDLTPPVINITNVTSIEDVITVSLRLDESGTAWCQATRYDFNVPTILEILDTNFHTNYSYSALDPFSTVTIELLGYDRPRNYDNSYLTPLVLGTDYDVYCYATDDLCQGCQVTNGVSFAHVQSTRSFIRTKDYTKPNMRYVAAESIAKDQILVTLQVDEGARVWCAAWDYDPNISPAMVMAEASTCFDSKGRQCGTFWVYDLDDIEDTPLDGVDTKLDYDSPVNWKYNQDVDIIVYNLTEEQDYTHIYCYAEDDETPANAMIYDSVSSPGPHNMHTMETEIGTVQTLDESPPSFTRLALQDPTAFNDRLIVTFQLNEAGTAYCRATRSDSGETTLRINQILTANYGEEVTSPSLTGYITIDKLEQRDTLPLYEAAQYDIYCWAKDSAVDTQGMARPNYDTQDYVDSPIGLMTAAPQGGLTTNVWITDSTPPTIIVVSREALGEGIIQVTLQLNEPGTIWCQIADKDTAACSTGCDYCRDGDVTDAYSSTPAGCYFETFIKGVDSDNAGSRNYFTTFRADVHVPYQDYDIDMDYIEKVTSPQEGHPLTAQYYYHIWCFAEDDWAIEANYSLAHGPEFVPPNGPNKIEWAHAVTVKDTIGQVLTLDQTPPAFVEIQGTQYSETQLQMTMRLDETGTIWCKPVRYGFAEPSINEILQNNEYNTACGTGQCTVTVENLDAKTLYDVWCYTEDDNVYPQQPNGRKFTAAEFLTLSTLDTSPPILTIVSAESPISTDIRIKVQMNEPGTVWCNSFESSTAYGSISFSTVTAAGYKSYVGLGLTPGGPINQNVEVVVTDRQEETQYDTYCTAQDTSTLTSINQILDPVTTSTQPLIGQIITMDQSPPTFEKLGSKGIDENTIEVTFKCNEECRAYCRVTRSDSGETSLSINRILKADYDADQLGPSGTDQTIQLSRLEDDSSLALLERGTLYDVYCWIRDEAQQQSCHASGSGASCEFFFKPNYQSQTYVDTAFGTTPPATSLSPLGGKMLHVRTPDTTPPNIIFIEAESTEEVSITVTLQLDEPGTAYCRAYTSAQIVDTALYDDISTGTNVYKNTVTNWNNIYKNFEVKVMGLSMETKYYVYCVAEDDELVEGATTISPAPTENNKASATLTESTGRYTLDLTPPIISVVQIDSVSETTSTVTVQLDEPGTVWCKAVRDHFQAPTINQIIAASFSSITLNPNGQIVDFTVLVDNLERDTEYDVYCHARDRGTEVEVGLTPDAGNPGNDATFDHVLTTKRDIHTMGDSSPPIVVSVTPEHQQTQVSENPVITIVFNEDIAAGFGSIDFTSQSGLTNNLDISQANTGTCTSAAKLRITLTNLTIDFDSSCSAFLTASTTWYVSFATGVLTDASQALNSAPAFGVAQSYYFDTGVW